MPTQIIRTLQVYPIAGGWIRPCSEHNFSPPVVGSDSSVCVKVILKICEKSCHTYYNWILLVNVVKIVTEYVTVLCAVCTRKKQKVRKDLRGS